MEVKTVKIGPVSVGDQHPARFMAELGTFYNKNIELAFQLVDAAVEADADIIKTEVLHSADVVLNADDVTTTYNVTGGKKTEKYYDLISRKVLPSATYRELFRYIVSKGKPFVASVYDFKGVDLLVEEGGAAIKLWRNNFNNFALIRYAGATRLPVIFDIVNLYPHQISLAVHTALKAGASGVILNYHPGKNPAAANEHNLRWIQKYKTLFGYPVGLSCHYRGEELLYAAVGAGVNILEKGVYSNPDEGEQNVITATSLANLKETIQKVKSCAVALGAAEISVTEPQDKTLHYGLIAATDLRRGDQLTADVLGFAFPNRGIGAEEYDLVLNSRVKNDFKAGQTIRWSDIEFMT